MEQQKDNYPQYLLEEMYNQYYEEIFVFLPQEVKDKFWEGRS